MNYQQVSTEQIIKNYKSISNGSSDIDEALSKYIERPDAFSRAEVWTSIQSLNDDIKKAESLTPEGDAIWHSLKSECSANYMNFGDHDESEVVDMVDFEK